MQHRTEPIATAARIAGWLALMTAAALLGWQTLRAPSDARELIVAASVSDAAGARRALDAGADVNAQDGAALMLAAGGGDAVLTRLLLARGADPSPPGAPGGYTPLLMAATSGHTEVIELLLDAGADVNHASLQGQTAVGVAAGWGHEPAVRLLLARGGSATGTTAGHPRGDPPLVSAARGGNASPQLLRCLIDAGADVNGADDEGTTPVMAAAALGRFDLVELLVRAGAHRDRRAE